MSTLAAAQPARIGGKHLRYRPGLEVAFDGKGAENAAVVQSLAWQSKA